MSDPSLTYLLLALAMEARAPLACRYRGHARVICPIILGHRNGAEMVLAYQVAGATSAGPLREPQWKCLRVAELRDLQLSDAPWIAGRAHRHPQYCVTRIDHVAER